MASPIEATLLLADAAQVDPGGKVHILGAGWSITTSPTAPQSVVALIEIPWDRCNTQLPMQLALVDADGQPVILPGQPGAPDQRMEFQSVIEAGRPPGVTPGTAITAPFSLNVPSMPLTPGRYSWRLVVADDNFLKSFTVSPPVATTAGQ